jgi:paraquat-inducible protein B
VFDQSVRGLVVGASMDFLGVDIGTVRSITLQRDLRRSRFPVEVRADLYPMRLGSLREALLRPSVPGAAQGAASGATPPATPIVIEPTDQPDTEVIARLMAQGLKAQMRTGNLLTGQLYIALDFFRDDDQAAREARAAAEAEREMRPKARSAAAKKRAERRAQRVALLAAQAQAEGVLTVPTVPGTLSELQPQVAQIVQRISRIPFDEIGKGVQGTLAQANSAIARLTPEAQKSLSEVQATLNRAQAALDRLDRNLLDESAPVQRQTEQTLAEVQRAAQSLRVLADYLQRHPESVLRGKPPDAPLPSGRENRPR